MRTPDVEIGQEARTAEWSIGAVAHMTQLSEDTLRVWERRYQFPVVHRSAGRQRLYSQHAVIQLQWVKVRLDEGMQVSQAIAALHQIPWTTAVTTSLRAAQVLQAPPPNEHLARVQRLLYEYLRDYNSADASTLLRDIETAYPRPAVILDVIRPTLAAIGDAWHRGEVDVTTEHFVSNYVRHHLLSLIQSSPPPFQVKPVVLACAPGELHEGSLLMLSALLRTLRWPTVYLGQSLPLTDLAAFTQAVAPALIVLVAMSEETALALADWPRFLPQADGVHLPLVGYGGRAFLEHPALVERLPGSFLGKTLGVGSARIHRLLLDVNALKG